MKEFIHYVTLEFVFFLIIFVLFSIVFYRKQKEYAFLYISFLAVFSLLPWIYPIPKDLLQFYGLLFISLAWVLIFKKYFLPNEGEVFREKGIYFALIGMTISLLFMKFILEIQLLNYTRIIPEIVLLKENLFWFYSITSQVFGIILTAIVVVGMFILDKYRHKTRKKKLLTQGVIGITIFSIPIIVLSIIGTIINSDIKIGAEISSFETTVVFWIFSATLLTTIFCIMFVGMLILTLLDTK